VLAGVNAGRTGEDGAAGVLDVLAQGVGGQGVLELDGLSGVLHEGDEEQTAQEGSGLRVDAVGERVPAAQDPGAAVVLEAGQPDVSVAGDDGLPARPNSGLSSGLPQTRQPEAAREARRTRWANHVR
jgi:hypothetical protein